MKRVLLVLLLLLITLAGYFATYHWATRGLRQAECSCDHPSCGMGWLRREYHLSEAQYAVIAKMHEDYRPSCQRMCQDAALANQKIHALVFSSPGVTPEIEAAFQEWAALQTVCRLAMLRHVCAVSVQMNPEDGRRYLQMALERIIAPGMEHASLLSE